MSNQDENRTIDELEDEIETLKKSIEELQGSLQEMQQVLEVKRGIRNRTMRKGRILKERTALRCAHADLKGAYEAYEAGDMHQHDWKAHKLTIDEMEEAFQFLLEKKGTEQ